MGYAPVQFRRRVRTLSLAYSHPYWKETPMSTPTYTYPITLKASRKGG